MNDLFGDELKRWQFVESRLRQIMTNFGYAEIRTPTLEKVEVFKAVGDETDIVEIVRQHVQLKPAGAVYKGLCPFHKEKTPSFIVTPARARAHSWPRTPRSRRG